MATAKKEPENDPVLDFNNEPVQIRIPLTADQKDDVFVRVNQETFLIKRGVYVTVPRYVANVLDEAERATLEAIQFEEKHTKPVD